MLPADERFHANHSAAAKIHFRLIKQHKLLLLQSILQLFQHYADSASSRHGLPSRSLPVAQRAQLLGHAWPGNVRELQNAAERFALGLDLDLDVELQGESSPTLQELAGNLSAQVEAFERSLISAELSRSHSSLRSLAEALGVPRKTLHDKLRKHGLSFADAGGSSPDSLD